MKRLMNGAKEAMIAHILNQEQKDANKICNSRRQKVNREAFKEASRIIKGMEDKERALTDLTDVKKTKGGIYTLTMENFTVPMSVEVQREILDILIGKVENSLTEDRASLEAL